MASNFHGAAFDAATLLKLELYRKYLADWLPTFIHRPRDRHWNGYINIYDFFSGPGKDKDGRDGSPIIAIRECLKYSDHLKSNGKIVHLYFSEAKPLKVKLLEQVVASFDLPETIVCRVHKGEFLEEFNRHRSGMLGAANLIFIDQCGIKEVNKEVFEALSRLRGSDFLFFIASSFLKRFQQAPEFTRHIDTADKLGSAVAGTDVHRAIASMYREMTPPDAKPLYVAPFSLKKGRNVYGVIFASSHLLGLEKFLTICWKEDKDRGEANFDIDHDNLPDGNGTIDMFQNAIKSAKLLRFERELEEMLLAGCFETDAKLFVYALEAGYLPAKHAKPIVKRLISEKLLVCEGQPRLSKLSLNGPRRIMRC